MARTHALNFLTVTPLNEVETKVPSADIVFTLQGQLEELYHSYLQFHSLSSAEPWAELIKAYKQLPAGHLNITFMREIIETHEQEQSRKRKAELALEGSMSGNITASKVVTNVFDDFKPTRKC